MCILQVEMSAACADSIQPIAAICKTSVCNLKPQTAMKHPFRRGVGFALITSWCSVLFCEQDYASTSANIQFGDGGIPLICHVT
jgi:hypothetical protein